MNSRAAPFAVLESLFYKLFLIISSESEPSLVPALGDSEEGEEGGLMTSQTILNAEISDTLLSSSTTDITYM